MLDRLLDLSRDHETVGPQVFFVTFRSTAEALARRLKCPVIWGGEEQPAGDFGSRQDVTDGFQANRYEHLVATLAAGGPGISLQDPTGEVPRTGWFLPNFDGNLLFQGTGRLCRDGGAWSQQYLVGLSGTYHEEVLDRVAGKLERLEVLNDGELLPAARGSRPPSLGTRAA